MTSLLRAVFTPSLLTDPEEWVPSFGQPSATPLWMMGLRWCLGAAVIWVAYQMLVARRTDFVIRYRAGRLQCQGKIPLLVQRPLAEFFATDLAVQDAIKVCGARTGRGLELRFRGPLTDGQKQRIRNFLLTRL